MSPDNVPSTPPAEQSPPPGGTSQHEEWLIDEAVDETFPASDPPSPSV